MKREISDFFKVNDVKYKENYNLSAISPVRIGAKTQFLVYPDSEEKLIIVVRFLRNNKIKHKILGRMSNVLPPDETYEGVIVRTDLLSQISCKGTSVDVSCGVSLPHIAKLTADAGLSGFEELSGIPGSVGGAILSNAGAFGREIADTLTKIRVFNLDTSEIEQIKEISFDYRFCGLDRDRFVILSSKFSLSRSNSVTANELIQRYREKRMATQPVGQASLGSTFKRPGKEVYAAKLIDDCGLKGMSIGGAKISEKHAGFIVNKGGSTAADYLALAEYARERVFEKFAINLEKEIEII